jgi:hypothetical protein
MTGEREREREREERKIMPQFNGHFVVLAHALRSDQLLIREATFASAEVSAGAVAKADQQFGS